MRNVKNVSLYVNIRHSQVHPSIGTDHADHGSSCATAPQRRRGESLNRTVIELLRQGLGVGALRSNGLARLAGGWSDECACVFERALAPFDHIDPEGWK